MSSQPPLPPALPATAFDRQRLVSRGPLHQVIVDLERYLVREPDARPLLFDDASGRLLTWPPATAWPDETGKDGRAVAFQAAGPDRPAGGASEDPHAGESAAGRRSGRPR